MSPFEEEDEGDVLAEVLPNMLAGDRVILHDSDCPTWSERRCACTPLIILGPSGKA